MRKDSQTLDAFFGFDGKENETKDTHWASIFQDTEFEMSKIKKLDVDKITHLLVDEHSMLSHEKYHHILFCVREKNPNMIIRFYGDIHQCPAPSKIPYNILECHQMLRSILRTTITDKYGRETYKEGYIIEMEYRKDEDGNTNQRCDDKILQVNETLKKYGTFPQHLYDNHDQEHP